MTLGFSLHWWRGVGFETDLFLIFVVCGFITIHFGKSVLLTKLRNIMEKLPAEKVRGK